MAVPTKPEIDFSYTGFAQGLGNNTFPGTQLDNDLANVVDAVSETIDFVSAVIRDDGALQNGVVTPASLGPGVKLGLAPPRPWVTGRAYAVDETVTINNSMFLCAVAHTSTAFNSDFGAGLWVLVVEFTVPAAIDDGAVTETKHATGGVSTRALGPLVVTNPKIGAAAVTSDKLAAAVSLALMPVGAELDYAGWAPPPGWLFQFGQEVSRTTYAALFNALCPAVTVNTTTSSAVLTGVPVDLRGLGLEGCPISGANIPAGAFIASMTANTITMSAGATGSAANVVARIMPWGVGDGATTFNLPDARDRASVGRGTMGGTAANRITISGAGNSGLWTGRIGAAGGVDRHTLTTAQLAVHAHAAFTSVLSAGSHSHTFVGPAAPVVHPTGSGRADTGTTTTLTTDPAGEHTHTAVTAIADAGSGEAHPNVQPSRVVNKIIFTGVV